jgi:hypothetical protein
MDLALLITQVWGQMTVSDSLRGSVYFARPCLSDVSLAHFRQRVGPENKAAPGNSGGEVRITLWNSIASVEGCGDDLESLHAPSEAGL